MDKLQMQLQSTKNRLGDMTKKLHTAFGKKKLEEKITQN